MHVHACVKFLQAVQIVYRYFQRILTYLQNICKLLTDISQIRESLLQIIAVLSQICYRYLQTFNIYASLVREGLKWDLIKMEIRGFTVKYAKLKAKKCNNNEVILQNKINELQQKLESNSNNSQCLNNLYAAKLRWQKIMHFKTKGAILRSKVRWYNEDERNTKYFFNLENRCQSMKNINKLKINDNTFIYNQYAIIDKQKQLELRINLQI